MPAFDYRRERMHLRETTAASLSEVAVNDNGQVLLRLIAPGWSKNGRYYPEKTLKESVTAFRKGTLTYINHPSRSEGVDRPERDVRDVVGALTENAFYDPSGPSGAGLYARASVRQDYRPLVDDLAEAIGMSIRADGTGRQGKAEGREGLIVDSIESADSVDYVTTPAAGGQVVKLLESVQNPEREFEPPKVTLKPPEIGQYVEAMRKAAEAIREAGHADIADELQAAYQEPEATEMSETTSTDDTSDTDTSGTEASPTPAAPESVPADDAETAADESAPIEAQESTSEEGDMTGTPGAETAPQQTPRSLMEAEIANMRRENAELRARDRARAVVSGVLSEGWLVPSQITNLTEALLTDIPITDQLQLDEAELIKRATAAREREEKVGFEVSEALGVGRPRDVGPSAATDTYEMPNYQTGLTETFQRLGMSESAAKTAAAGRA